VRDDLGCPHVEGRAGGDAKVDCTTAIETSRIAIKLETKQVTAFAATDPGVKKSLSTFPHLFFEGAACWTRSL
jgi:hypothetical protein